MTHRCDRCHETIPEGEIVHIGAFGYKHLCAPCFEVCRTHPDDMPS